MKKKSIIKRAACAVLSLSILCTSLTVFAAGQKWTEIYSGGQNQTSHGGSTNIFTDLYDGKLLPGADGEVYRITWEGKWYDSGIDGGVLRASDSKTEKELFWRNNLSISNQIQMTDTADNPEKFKFIMTFDFGTSQAVIEVFDTDRTTKLGELTADLSGLEGITGIYYRLWSSGNIVFSKISETSLFTIEKDTTGIPDPSEITWQEFYKGDGADASHGGEEKHYHDLYSGELSADTGDQYEIKWNTSFYRGGGVNNGNFILSDGEKELILFTKEKNANSFGDGIVFGVGTDDNPHALAIDIVLNFEEKTANIQFYDDKNRQIPLGVKTVSLDALNGVKSIYYYMPEVNGFTSPRSSSVVIKKGSILPKVRNVKGITKQGAAEKLFGEDALDLTKIKVNPALESLTFDLNAQINMQNIDQIIMLKKEGESENLLTDFRQKGVEVTADLTEELEENTSYVLTVGKDITAEITGYPAKDSFSLSFTSGRRKMTGAVSGLKIENGALVGNVSFANAASTPKSWAAVAACYDAAGKMIWCGAYEDGQSVETTLDDTITIALPDGTLPEGTVKTIVYLWDSVAASEIYAAGAIAEGV